MYFILNSFRSLGQDLSSPNCKCSFILMAYNRLGYAQETLRPIYHRAAWSFACAFYGRRPLKGPNGRDDSELTRQELRLVAAAPDLSKCFAITEYKGDWKYHKECFGFSHYWKAARICHRCNAARLPGHGVLFSSIGGPWNYKTTAQCILECMPAAPNPLILVPGFHVTCVRLDIKF